jgi:HAD superfamily hydrolase (TIGR01509 family)
MLVDAVVFDLDGVLLASEPVWAEVRRTFALAHGGRWHEGAQRQMMGMSSREWAAFMRTQLHVSLPGEEIIGGVLTEMAARYRRALPLVPDATEAVARLATRWPLGLASSSNRPLIDLALARARLGSFFRVTLSTEEIDRGKPAPDVYLAVADRLGVASSRCAAVEDSANGLRAAHAAGMRVIALPNADFPPDSDGLARANAVIGSLADLTERLVDPTITR